MLEKNSVNIVANGSLEKNQAVETEYEPSEATTEMSVKQKRKAKDQSPEIQRLLEICGDWIETNTILMDPFPYPDRLNLMITKFWNETLASEVIKVPMNTVLNLIVSDNYMNSVWY